MTKANHLTVACRSAYVVAILGLFLWFSGCSTSTPEVKPVTDAGDADVPTEIIWSIKAIHPEGSFMDVKALDQEGNIYDVKAIQYTDQRHLMDIKALMGAERWPVKMLMSEDRYAPVKAIGGDGTIYDIKALTPEGGKLDVKGVGRSGNIIHLKAISSEGSLYGIKAISPEGQLNDVKGVKMSKEGRESVVSGVDVHAHIKALPQAGCVGDHDIWHVKAIHPEGRTLDVKAIDNEGHIYDVKAIQDSDQRHLMDVKAFIGGREVPVKILVSDDRYAPVKAIGSDGAIYDIKALTAEGVQLDVKGVSRSGNILHIKAISSDGAFYGIKAISPEGEMNDVKGVKMSDEDREAVVNGVEVHAHIKALPQTN